jgi:hypothetical protein
MSQSQELKTDATVSRRFVLTLTSLLGLLDPVGVSVLSNFLFFTPRVTYGEPSRFRVGLGNIPSALQAADRCRVHLAPESQKVQRHRCNNPLLRQSFAAL